MPEDVEKSNFVINVFLFLTQNLYPNGLDTKLDTLVERDYAKMIWNRCVPHKFTKLTYLKQSFIELSQPHITYQKANNIIVKFVEEYMQNKVCLKKSFANSTICLFLAFSKNLQ